MSTKIWKKESFCQYKEGYKMKMASDMELIVVKTGEDEWQYGSAFDGTFGTTEEVFPTKESAAKACLLSTIAEMETEVAELKTFVSFYGSI
jgi:hypothetical protein